MDLPEGAASLLMAPGTFPSLPPTSGEYNIYQNSKSESTLEEEMGLGGATADDTEAELIRGICELELLEGEKGCWVSLPQPVLLCKFHLPLRSHSLSGVETGKVCPHGE